MNTIYNPFPIGEIFIYERRVLKVAAHLEGVWMGTTKPWYGVAFEVLAGSRENLHTDTKHHWAVAGELPEQYDVICLNGGSGGWSRDYTPLKDVKRTIFHYPRRYYDLILYTWESGNLVAYDYYGYPDTYEEPGVDPDLQLILNGTNWQSPMGHYFAEGEMDEEDYKNLILGYHAAKEIFEYLQNYFLSGEEDEENYPSV